MIPSCASLFTADALTDHIRTHLRGIAALQQNGFALSAPTVTVLSTDARRPLSDRIPHGLLDVSGEHEVLTKPYYNGLRFRINVASSFGEIPLLDGRQ
jgi:hypothetical protein